MSRTVKGSKGWGFEFWSKRPGNRHGGGVGRYAKTLTHSRERQEGRREVRRQNEGAGI